MKNIINIAVNMQINSIPDPLVLIVSGLLILNNTYSMLKAESMHASLPHIHYPALNKTVLHDQKNPQNN